jgi:uncharacterized protein with HEPN domain
MSDPGRGRREWCFYLEDMIKFALKVQLYTTGLDQVGFIANDVTHGNQGY